MADTKDFSSLEERVKIKFKNNEVLTQAFVHRSYLNEHPGFKLGHNERLEFLGDAVLELAVTEYLYEKYPNPEGELTNWRAALVNAKTLSGVAQDLGLEEYLYLSHGESKDGGSKARQYILANAMEAFIGAIYLDQGMKVTKKFVDKFVLSLLPEILERRLYIDPKSRFQESAQEKVGMTPNYRVMEEHGPDHAKEFIVGAFLGDELVATGTGTSKQEAQVAAAESALEIKEW
ncbi:ribonuclease III [Candidatus Uhrbacteria bacterium RIFOXYC2_FULL_47_19]|uniref:Ribonuclease 3 n=1 Tax=Candidatus Uhrbacteria bacterium RIFOXYC2_FULL_47_19 TaxID=1802424 RepID=A0A1F7WED6_9BACT|nr:MAG: ribonuclease III [Candidatus Uhrbacteria bacterium RIFOXYC2_FULL_47_19]HCC22176.1 ribonuclease III [Candidatus Uhrbacteria bacterium]